MAHSKMVEGWLKDFPTMVELILGETSSAAMDLFGTPEGTETTVTITIQSCGTHGFRLIAQKAPFEHGNGN